MSNDELSRPNAMDTAFGCVHCMTGKERELAAEIMQRYPGIRATAVMQTKRHTEKGVTTLQNDVILKGYLFIEVPIGTALFDHSAFENVISILAYDNGDWHLSGEDANYAEWIFRYNGIIRLSKAYQIGDHIQIIDGPLKDMEGYIIRMDRRNRSGQVALHVGSNIIKAWLGFEIVNEYREEGKRESSAPRNTASLAAFNEAPGISAGL